MQDWIVLWLLSLCIERLRGVFLDCGLEDFADDPRPFHPLLFAPIRFPPIYLPPDHEDGQEETKNGLPTSTIAPAKEKEEKERQKEG